MPELPEVETIVRAARPRLLRRRIGAFHSRWVRQVSPGEREVRAAIVGATIADVRRRGKFIVIELERGSRSAGVLLIHLRMSGRFEWGRTDDRPDSEPRHVRATFDLSGGVRLYFCDARKFGRLRYVADLKTTPLAIGPEPLDRSFTPARLAGILRSRRKLLKPLLLDQAAIAGLGNIYTDESLFRAGLHPLRKSSSLTDPQIAALHQAIRRTLREGIRHSGTSLDWAYPEGKMQTRLLVYGRGDQPCRRCGDTIVVLRVGQRSTHVCPTCQPKARRRAAMTNPGT
ncbi:MAG: DNA-formamidopyrimidine glycosylase [Planctomycetes bacterium]|nr:DNA-formamidopyrimidine glycosylase [Planctomycetota bacterium]